MITFDLANMELSPLPFIVHDMQMLLHIEKKVMAETIKAYDAQKSAGKQVFIAFDSLTHALRSTMAWTQYESVVAGVATSTFSQEKLSNMMISMPPMVEQERIVSVLDQIFEEK